MNRRHNFEKNYAIVIGINNYAEKPLKAAAKDAERLCEILRSDQRGSDEKYEVLLLVDAQATHSEVNRVLENLKQGKIHFPDGKIAEIKENNRLLIYFSGHGVASDLGYSQNIRDESEKEKILKKQYLQCQDGNPLPLKDLFDSFKLLKCDHLLLILDCCFAGQAIINTGSDTEGSVFKTASFEDEEVKYSRQYKLMQKTAWAAITSSGFEEAIDHTNPDQVHSFFAQALFRALECKTTQKADSNNDGIATDNEIYTYLKNDRYINEYQSPQKFALTFSGKKQSGQYFFLMPDFKPISLTDIKDKSPYKGLLSYEKDDAFMFKGRNQLVEDLFGRIKQGQKLTVVTGASGSGKSSLVKAGLLPRIEKENWTIYKPIRPGESPFRTLIKELVPQEGETNPSNISQKLEGFYNELNQRYTNRKGFAKGFARNDENTKGKMESVFSELAEETIQRIPNRNNYLLVIDQFEELVTLCQPLEREYFLKLLIQILNKTEHLKIVLTVRSDFEIYFRGSSADSNSSNNITDSNISQYWNDKTRFIVEEMGIYELRQAIEKPARIFGVDFEDQLVSKIVDDVRGMPGALALLSFTLEKLYEKAEGYRSLKEPITITLEHYQDLGGVVNALTQSATEAYEELSKSEFDGSFDKLAEDKKAFTKEYERSGKLVPGKDELAGKVRQTMMQQLLLRMVTTQGGRSAKRPVPLAELEYPDWKCRHKDATYRMRQVIDYLISKRLIVSNLRESVVQGKKKEICYIEPAHDALILYWDKLTGKKAISEEEQKEREQVEEQGKGWLEEQEENLILRDRLMFDLQKWKEQEPRSIPFINWVGHAIELDIKSGFSEKASKSSSKFLKKASILPITVTLSLLRLTKRKPGLGMILLGIYLIFLGLILAVINEFLIIPGAICFLLGCFLIPSGLLWFIVLSLPKLIWQRFKRSKANLDGHHLTAEQAPMPLSKPKKISNDAIARLNKLWKSRLKGTNNDAIARLNKLWEDDPRLEQVKQFLYTPESWLNKDETEFVRQSAIRRKKGEFEKSFGALVVIVIAAVLVGAAWWGRREASIKNVAALRQSAEANLQSNDSLDAAVDILRARKALQGFRFKPSTELAEVQGTMHRIVYAGRERNRLQNRERLFDVALSSDGKLLAAVGKDDNVYIYQVPENSSQLGAIKTLSGSIKHWIGFLLNFNQVDILKGKSRQLKLLSTGQGDVHSVALLKINNIELLATGAKDGSVKLWKIENGGDEINLVEGNSELLDNDQKSISIEFTPKKTQEKPDAKKRLDSVEAMASDPEGKKLAIGRENGEVTLWRIEGEKDKPIVLKEPEIIQVPKEGESVYSIALNSKYLAVVGRETIKVWEIDKKEIDKNPKTVMTISLKKQESIYSAVVFLKNGDLEVALSQTDKDAHHSDKKSSSVTWWKIENKELEPDTKFSGEFQIGQETIYRMAYSGDEKLATLGADERVILWDASSSEKTPMSNKASIDIIQPSEASASVTAIASSQDGKLLATGDENGTVRIWDTSGKPQSRFSIGQEPIYQLALSKDGKLIATVGEDGKVKLWDKKGNELKDDFSTEQTEVYSVAFTPDGRLAIGGEDGTIKFWKPNKEKNDDIPIVPDERTISTKQGAIYSIAFSNKDKQEQIATLGEDDTLVVQPTPGSQNSLKRIIRLPEGSAEGRKVAFISDILLATIQANDDKNKVNDDKVIFWTKRGGEWVQDNSLATQQGNLRSFTSFSTPKGDQLATVGEDGLVKLWNIQFQVPQKSCKSVFSISKNDQHDKAISSEGASAQGQTRSVEDTNVVFSPNGKRLVAIDKSGVKLWEIISSTDSRQTPCSNAKEDSWLLEKPQLWLPKKVTKVVFSPDSNKLATIEQNGAVKLWDVSEAQQPKLLYPLSENPQSDKKQPLPVEATNLAFSKYGNKLATIEQNKVVKLWDISEAQQPQLLFEKPLHPLPGNSQSQGKQLVEANLALSQYGDRLAMINNDNKVSLWDISKNSPKPLDPIITEQGSLTSIAFSPDGKLLITGAEDGTVRLGDTSGGLYDQINTGQGKLKSFIFSSDGKLLVTLGEKNNTKGEKNNTKTLKVWYTLDNKLRPFKAIQFGILNAVFDEHNARLITAEKTGKIVQWDIGRRDDIKDDDKLAQEVCALAGDYLKNNPDFDSSDRQLCTGISAEKGQSNEQQVNQR